MTEQPTYFDIMAKSDVMSLRPRKVLPPETFTDREPFKHEMRTIFHKNWLLAGLLHDLQEPGTLKPTVVAGQPIVLLRDYDHNLRCFHNVCSHRGMELVCETQKKRRRIVCPYHAWTYGLDGKLEKTPMFGNQAGDDRAVLAERLGLKEVRTATWLDFVFVNFDDEAGPFEDFAGPIQKRWENFDLSTLTYADTWTFEYDVNWKLVIENFLECYHVPYVHHQLDAGTDFEPRYPFQEGVAGRTSHIYGMGAPAFVSDGSEDDAFPTWGHSSGETPPIAEYFLGFPVFMMGLMPDFMFAWTLEPVGPEKTRHYLHYYFAGESAMDDRCAKKRQEVLDRWRRVNEEDWELVQRSGKGQHSMAWRGPVLAPGLEDNIRDFHQHVASHYGPDAE